MMEHCLACTSAYPPVTSIPGVKAGVNDGTRAYRCWECGELYWIIDGKLVVYKSVNGMEYAIDEKDTEGCLLILSGEPV